MGPFPSRLAARFQGPDFGAEAEFVGTPDYISPEALRGEPTSYRADLWSLGALLFTLLCGRSPFGARSTELTLRRVLTATYQLPQQT